MKVEIVEMYLQAKKGQGLLMTAEAKRKAWNSFSPRAFWRTWLWGYHDFKFVASKL